MATTDLFFGLIVKPDKRYTKAPEDAFCITKACLDPSTAGKSPTVVLVETKEEEFIICVLSKDNLSENLNLRFADEEHAVIKATGEGTVHLTGFNGSEEEGMDTFYDGEEGDSEEEDVSGEEEEEEEEEVPQLVNGSNKRKMKESKLDKLLAAKKLKGENGDVAAAVETAKNAKKKLLAENKKKAAPAESDDDDEEDEDDDEEDMDEDDSDEDMEEDDESEEEEEENKTKGKKNGASPAKQQNGSTPGKKNKEKQDKTPSKKEGKKGETPAKKGDQTPGKKGDQTPGKKGDEKTPKKSEQQKDGSPKKTPKKTLKGGIVAQDLKIGNGPEAKRGKMVGMYYDGRLATNNKRFDANMSGDSFKFRLGAGEVIKGWDIGVEGMKVGGKRRLTIPPKFAYGNQAMGKDIPANSTLVFDVECKFVK